MTSLQNDGAARVACSSCQSARLSGQAWCTECGTQLFAAPSPSQAAIWPEATAHLAAPPKRPISLGVIALGYVAVVLVAAQLGIISGFVTGQVLGYGLVLLGLVVTAVRKFRAGQVGVGVTLLAVAILQLLVALTRFSAERT